MLSELVMFKTQGTQGRREQPSGAVRTGVQSEIPLRAMFHVCIRFWIWAAVQWYWFSQDVAQGEPAHHWQEEKGSVLVYCSLFSLSARYHPPKDTVQSNRKGKAPCHRLPAVVQSWSREVLMSAEGLWQLGSRGRCTRQRRSRDKTTEAALSKRQPFAHGTLAVDCYCTFLMNSSGQQLMHKGIPWPHFPPAGPDHSWSHGADTGLCLPNIH